MNFLKRIYKALGRFFGLYEAGRIGSVDRTYIPGQVTDERFDYTSSTRWEIVRKCRWFEKNDAIANRLGQIFEQFVAGPNGLQVIPSTASEDYNQVADETFSLWCNFPDIASPMNFASFVGMTAWRWFFDGEVFWLKTRETTGRAWPRLQMIATHRVGTPDGQFNNPNIVDGAELDAKGRPVAWWIDDSFEGGQYRRVEARDIIHIFEPAYPGANRGVPLLHPVLNDIHDLNDLELFEMRAAKHASAKTEIIETATGETSDEDILKGTAPADGETAKYYEQVFVGAKVLRNGDKFHQFISDRPSAAVQWFLRHRLARVCAGVGIPVQLAFPESIQGTVERAELDIAAGAFKSRCAVLSAGVKEAYIYVMGWYKSADRRLADPPADWWNVEIVPPRAPNVDVGRNSSAMLAELAAGATTYKKLYGQLGENYRRELKQRADEAALINRLARERSADGVTPAQISIQVAEALSKQAPKSPDQQPQEPDQDEEPIDA